MSTPVATKPAVRGRKVTWAVRLGWMSIGVAIASMGAGTITWYRSAGVATVPVVARAASPPRSVPPPEILDALTLASDEFGVAGIKPLRSATDAKSAQSDGASGSPLRHPPDTGFVSVDLPMTNRRIDSYPIEFVSVIPNESVEGFTFAPHDVGSTGDPASTSLVSPGESFDGFTLPPDDDRLTKNATVLSLRRGCAWGVPGRTPYKGTVRQALVGAGLPHEVVNKIDLMVERKMVSDRVKITRDSIQTENGKRRFEPTIAAMGFGKTLCFGTRVNFPAGHVELADLYEATDGEGAKFSVMVPYVCGNVSVLAARAERADTPPGGVRSIPEPGTLASLMAALAAMAAGARMSRRRAEDRSRNP